MPDPQQSSGSFRLFNVAGINVYLHWSWLLVAVVELQWRQQDYQSIVWNVAEYLSIFLIVLLHEFGHAFACRSVGGQANRIVLWPLGGIAFVSPPPRPGALLWSIAAGPLVNVILLVPTFLFAELSAELSPDFQHFAISLRNINLLLLIFNMLPIYPLDGGQIVQSLLWFVLGRARSLMAASVFGLIVSGCLMIPLAMYQQWWLCLMAAFIGMRSWAGFKHAKFLGQVERLPKHTELACPDCHAPPVKGETYRCPNCSALFDVFDWRGVCPRCQTRAADVTCLNCFRPQPLAAWYPAAEATVN